MSVTPAGAQTPSLYKQTTAPNALQSQLVGYPIPAVGDLWVDETANLLKRCAAVSPYTWVSVEGGGGGGANFADDETPAGTINGVNDTFTLANVPSPAGSLELYLNGLLQRRGTDYTLAGGTITYAGGNVPLTGENHRAWYRF